MVRSVNYSPKTPKDDRTPLMSTPKRPKESVRRLNVTVMLQVRFLARSSLLILHICSHTPSDLLLLWHEMKSAGLEMEVKQGGDEDQSKLQDKKRQDSLKVRIYSQLNENF